MNQFVIRDNYPKVFARLKQFWPHFKEQNNITANYAEMSEELTYYFYLSFFKLFKVNCIYEVPVSADIKLLNHKRIMKEIKVLEDMLYLPADKISSHESLSNF